MKIAIAFEIFYPVVNGIITSARNLAENLVAQGHEVIFFAPETGEFQEPFISGSIPVYYIRSVRSNTYPGMRYVLPWNRQVLAVFRREKIDLLHMTGPWFLTMACIVAARKHRVPIIHTFHTMVHESDYLLYMVRSRALVPAIREIGWVFYGWFIRRCEAHTAPSRMACRTLDRQFPGADTRFISNGVDLDQFARCASREELKQRYSWYTDRTIIYVGRMGQEKSVGDLLEAMALLVHHEDVGYPADSERPAEPGRPVEPGHTVEPGHAALPDRAADPAGTREGSGINLILVGDGPAEERYRRHARRLRLGDRVRFLGRIPHAELLAGGLIHHARAFVTASTTENQPMTVIEAICCGVPAIVPEVPGIDELVVDNGLRFPPHDVKALAKAIVRVCTDDKLHDRCVAATNMERQRFDGRQVARRFLELYREVCERPR